MKSRKQRTYLFGGAVGIVMVITIVVLAAITLNQVRYSSTEDLNAYLIGKWSNLSDLNPMQIEFYKEGGKTIATGSYLYNQGSRIEGASDGTFKPRIVEIDSITESNGLIKASGTVYSTYAGTYGRVNLTVDPASNHMTWDIPEDSYPAGSFLPRSEDLYNY